MKGPIGMILIGGGVILIAGLFTGKIVLPGAAPTNPQTTPNSGNPFKGNVTGIVNNVPGAINPPKGAKYNPGATTSWGQAITVGVQKDGGCPPGYVLMAVIPGVNFCMNAYNINIP